VGGQQANLVPYLIHLMKDTAPFLVGLLAICALAAMQSTGAAYMSTASGMLTRDIVKRFIVKDMTETQQTMWGRITVLIVVDRRSSLPRSYRGPSLCSAVWRFPTGS
jgi:Na+/proline symporter